STEEDLSGITGETKLRLTALNKEDKVIDVLDGSKPEAEPAEFVDRLIRLDDSPPDVLAFVHVPRRVVRGGAFVVGANAADKEADVSRVRFYLGKTLPDDKLPQEVVVREGAFDEEEGVWNVVGRIPVAADQASPLRLNVVAVNGVGLAATRSVELPVVDSG